VKPTKIKKRIKNKKGKKSTKKKEKEKEEEKEEEKKTKKEKEKKRRQSKKRPKWSMSTQSILRKRRASSAWICSSRKARRVRSSTYTGPILYKKEKPVETPTQVQEDQPNQMQLH
jgi:hypothetical protein